MSKIHEVIDEKLHDDAFDVRALCKSIFKSRTQVFRTVKAETGLSPQELISQKRLERAKSLLENAPGKSVQQVAEECGFKEASWFGRAFKKRFGKTPGAVKGKT